MSLPEIDSFLFRFINNNLQNSVFDISMPLITDRYYFLIIALILVLIIRDKKAAIVPIFLTAVSVALSDWASNILKHLFERSRPCHTLEEVRLLVGCGSSFSMPSNHAANASAVVLVLSYHYRKWLRWMLVIIAAFVGFSRVYVGVHYPSDVVVGASVGVIVSMLVIRMYERMSLRYKTNPYNTAFFVSLLVFSLFRIFYITSGIIDLSPDEAHYWEWSRRLDISYYSKGPMIAYLIAVGTTLFGDNVFGIRIMAVMFYALSSIAIYLLGRKLFDEPTGMAAAMLMQIIPLFATYSVVFTIDSPFIFFWIISLLLFWDAINPQKSEVRNQKLETDNKKRYGQPKTLDTEVQAWLLLGITVGLGLLTKYTMAFFYVCAFLFLVTSRQHRGILFTRSPYISLGASLIVFSPVILWNYNHNWVTLRHTAGQAHINDQWSVVSSQWGKYFFEFLGSQIGVITPVVFFMLLYALLKLIKSDYSLKSRFLFWFSMPVIVFFLLKSIHGKVQANWAMTGYITGIIAFSAVFLREFYSFKKGLRILIASALLLSAFVTAVAHYPSILNLPPDKDPTSRLRGWKDLGSEVSRIREQIRQQNFIFSDRYQVSSQLAFYVKGKPVTYCVNLGRRMNQYDLWTDFSGLLHYDAIFVKIGDGKMPPVLREAFSSCEKRLLKAYDKNKRWVRDYSIFTCYDFKGMEAKKPETY